jgi:mercuric ion binding protein
MRQILAAAIMTLAVILSGRAIAAEQSVTLRIENMYCASCPYIVQQTLVGVPGVTRVEITYQRAAAVVMAVVDFEDTQADVTALTAATSSVGFPATVIQ